jgi:hypothetical protein
MAAPIEYNIKILGGAGEELKRVGGGFGETNKHAHEAKEGVALFEAELGKLKGGLGGIEVSLNALAGGGPVFTFDLAEGVRSVVEVVSEAIEKIAELGKEIVGVAADTQDLNLAINLKVGKEGAEGVEALAKLFEGRTRYSGEQIKRAVLPLLDIGLTNDNGLITSLATVAADLETRSGGRQKLNESLEGFAMLAKRGQISPKMLAPLGIGTKEYFTALATALHTDIDDAKARAKKGQVDSALALSTLVGVVQAKEGGQIGGAALAGGATLGGTLARLGNIKETLFSQLADTPGLNKLQGLLDDIFTKLSGPEGRAAMVQLGDAIGTVADGARTAGAFISTLSDAVQTAAPFVAAAALGFAAYRIAVIAAEAPSLLYAAALGTVAIWEGVATAAQTALNIAMSLNPIGLLVAGVAIAAVLIWKYWEPISGFFSGLWETVSGFAGRVYQGAIDIGANLIEGIVNGITGALHYVEDAVGHLGDAIVGKLKGVLGIHSPSRVFMDLGGFTSEGFALGIEQGGDRVSQAASRTMVSRVTGAVQPQAVLSGGPAAAPSAPSVTNHFNFPNAREPRECAEAVREELVKLAFGLQLGLGVRT